MADLRSRIDVVQLAESRQNYIGRLLQNAARSVSVQATERLRARGHQGLTLAHTTLLAYLDLDGTRITVLAERAGITKQSMGQLVMELEQRGYVARQVDPTDRRATLVTFTEAGWQFLVDAGTVKRDIEAEYADLLGEEQLETLRATLSRVITQAETAASETPPPHEP
jgi:DNA-binding MarR family transcriptional regulator